MRSAYVVGPYVIGLWFVILFCFVFRCVLAALFECVRSGCGSVVVMLDVVVGRRHGCFDLIERVAGVVRQILQIEILV